MPLMDEFKEERASIKNGTPKQKWQYFKDYYMWTVIIAVLSIAFIGALAFQILTKKTDRLYAVLLNAAPYEDDAMEAFQKNYADFAGINLQKEQITFDTGILFIVNSPDDFSYEGRQKLETYVGAGILDVMMGGDAEFAFFASGGSFSDLRDVLTDEHLKRFEPYLYYVDGIRYDAGDRMVDKESDIDHRDPSAMEDPIPVAVYVDSCEELPGAYYFRNANDGVALGIYCNAPHKDSAVALIEYLLKDL